MRRSFLSVVLLVGFVTGAAALALLLFRGRVASDPAAALPASTTAALIVPSVPRFLNDVGGTRMAPARGESEWDLLAEIAADLLAARGIEFEPEPGWLSRSLRGAAALGWTPPSRPGGPSRLVLALEMPSRRIDLLGLVERSVLPDLASQGVVWRRREHRGRPYGTLRFPGASEVVGVATRGRLAILTISAESMRQSLAALDRRDASLVADPAFRRIRSDLRGRSDLLAYAGGDLLASALRGAPRTPRLPWLHAIAASARVAGAGVSLRVARDARFRERVRVLIPGVTTTPAARLFAGSPRRITIGDALPEGYPFRIGAAISPSEEAWESLPEWLAPILGVEPERLRGRLQGLSEFMGPEARRDLLATLGSEAAAAMSPDAGEPPVLALKPADDGAARRLLGRLDGLARAAEAYHFIALEGGASVTTYAHEKLAPHRPSWARVGEALLLSDAPEPLAALLERPRGSRRAPAGAEAGWERARLPDEKAHVVAVASPEELLSWIQGLAAGEHDPTGEAVWRGRLRDLIPGSGGPLPPFHAVFRIARDGLDGEWTGPLSPVLMAALFAASPGIAGERRGPPESERTAPPDPPPSDPAPGDP